MVFTSAAAFPRDYPVVTVCGRWPGWCSLVTHSSWGYSAIFNFVKMCNTFHTCLVTQLPCHRINLSNSYLVTKASVMKSSAYKVILPLTFTQVHSLQANITHHSTHLSVMMGRRKLSPMTTEYWLWCEEYQYIQYSVSWVCLSTAAHHSHEEYCIELEI